MKEAHFKYLNAHRKGKERICAEKKQHAAGRERLFQAELAVARINKSEEDVEKRDLVSAMNGPVQPHSTWNPVWVKQLVTFVELWLTKGAVLYILIQMVPHYSTVK